MTEDTLIGDYRRLDACYALALQQGDYRRALRFAIRGYRNHGRQRLWRDRIRGCWTRRNDGS